MRPYIIRSTLLTINLLILISCNTSITNNASSDKVTDIVALTAASNASLWVGGKATGEFKAKWAGCEDDHEGIASEDEGCGGQGGEDEGDGSSPRPSRDFYVNFNVQVKKDIKGEVTFIGIDNKTVKFNGEVTWVIRGETVEGHQSNELFFGGVITDGTVTQKCFLFSMQDNGEGANDLPDRLQYRLYNSDMPSYMPDHLPKGHPIALYEGNLQVH